MHLFKQNNFMVLMTKKQTEKKKRKKKTDKEKCSVLNQHWILLQTGEPFCFCLHNNKTFFTTVVVLKISIFQVQYRSLLSYTYFMKNDYYYIAYNIIVAILYWNDANVSMKPLMAKKPLLSAPSRLCILALSQLSSVALKPNQQMHRAMLTPVYQALK